MTAKDGELAMDGDYKRPGPVSPNNEDGRCRTSKERRGFVYRRGSGAGPGGRISGSPVLTCARVTKNTAAVQLGNKSKPGSSSAASDGRNAQCQPSRRISSTPTRMSRTVSAGEMAPSAKSGKAAIWRASATMAIIHARRCSGVFRPFQKSRIPMARPPAVDLRIARFASQQKAIHPEDTEVHGGNRTVDRNAKARIVAQKKESSACRDRDSCLPREALCPLRLKGLTGRTSPPPRRV